MSIQLSLMLRIAPQYMVLLRIRRSSRTMVFTQDLFEQNSFYLKGIRLFKNFSLMQRDLSHQLGKTQYKRTLRLIIVLAQNELCVVSKLVMDSYYLRRALSQRAGVTVESCIKRTVVHSKYLDTLHQFPSSLSFLNLCYPKKIMKCSIQVLLNNIRETILDDKKEHNHPLSSNMELQKTT